MKQFLYPALASLTLVAACETTTPEAPIARVPMFQPGTGQQFNERDFSWSRGTGPGSIYGVMTYRSGDVRYSCAGRDVILAPETPWVRRRMYILYGSTQGAAVPVDIVRARTPSAGAGDYASYARKTTCDGSSRFAFQGLPIGAWYVITLAKPDDGSSGTMAVMRRVESRTGARSITLD